VRVYRRDEVEIGMHWAGLDVTHCFGNFKGEPYTDDSERIILVAHKPR
jgi:hypothetical protein